VSDLEREVTDRGLSVLVGYQFRFNPGLRQLRDWIQSGAIGTVVSARAHWGEYLPDMHPWEDYRQGYAAREELGGGVLLTLCHPFDYLRWLVGDIERISAVESRRDHLAVPVETCVDVTLTFSCGASGHIHLNFVQRPTEHRVEVIGTSGTVRWNQADDAAHLYSSATTGWQTVRPPVGFGRNTMFIDEMRHFLACVHGDAKPMCTLSDGIAALEAVLRAKRALAPRVRPVLVA
jgi:predicted dehydrogenase